MTPLQQMAFERVATINEECRKLFPKRWDGDATAYNMPMEDFQRFVDLLFEQQNFVEALWEEERRDGCEETI
jgi:hypothetical protein